MTNEQQTGDDGKATFQLEYGDYVATITKDGYQTKTENIAFRSNHKNFTIALESASGTGTVTVTAVNSEQTPLEYANINLIDGNKIIGAGFTDDSGTTILYEVDGEGVPTEIVANVPFGTYSLVGTWYDEDADKHYRYQGTLTVDGDEEITITLTEQ